MTALHSHLLASLSTRALNLDHFFEGLLALFAESIDEEVVSGHLRAYARLVLETASKSSDGLEDAPDVKTFASYFVNKAPAFSRTKAGQSALLLETYLMRSGGDLFGRFVETVLDSPTTYRAVFQGRLDPKALDRIKADTESFATYEIEVQAGDRDHERGLISDVTILLCTAGPDTAKRYKALDSKRTGADGKPTTKKLAREESPSFSESSLLPRDRSAYLQVISEGGLSSAAVLDVFECNPFDDAGFTAGRLSITDPNGVSWLSEDGARWSPDRTNLPVEPLQKVCDTVVAEQEVRDLGTPPAHLPLAPLVERSNYGTWALFEAPLESLWASSIVTFRAQTYAVPHSLADLCEVVTALREVYDGFDAECDLAIEMSMLEYAQTHGWPIANHDTAAAVLMESDGSRDLYLRDVYEVAEEVPEEEEEETDRMDDPEFYRDDLQTYYDLLITTGANEVTARQKLRKKFGSLKGLVVTPTGEVRVPGVVDRPNPPAPLAPPVGGEEELPPEEEPAPEEPPAEKEEPAAEGLELSRGGPHPLSKLEHAVLGAWSINPGATPPLLRSWAREAGVPEVSVDRAWEEATQALTLGQAALSEWVDAAEVVKGRALQESAPGVQQTLPLHTLDDALLYYVTFEDGYLDEFNLWVEHRCPHLSDALDAWQPVDQPLQESRLDDRDLFRSMLEGGKPKKAGPRKTGRRSSHTTERKKLDDRQTGLVEKWRRLLNVPSKALIEYHSSPTWKAARDGAPERLRKDFMLANESTKHLFRMRATVPERWSGTEWNWLGRQMKFIEGLRRTASPLVEHGLVTRKYTLLKAWGHDPSRPGMVSEAQVTELLARDPRAAHRMIDALPGPAPHFVGDVDEYSGGKGPDYKTLKRGRKKLSDSERAEVMGKKAVWHHGPNGEETPAVWKSSVGGKDWFVTNTHRAYNVCPTCKGAIGRFHDFIKSTA